MRNPFARRDNAPSEPTPPVADTEAGGEVPVDVPPAPGPHRRGGPVSATFTLRDLLVVTYALPAERVRPLVPADLPLDMLPTPDGERLAFVQTLCAFHADARWSLLPEGVGQSFHQISHRALVRREGRKGAFLLHTLIGSDEARLTQRTVNRDAEFARFSVSIAGNPARDTYTRYKVRAVADEGQAQFDVSVPTAEANDSGDAAAPFSTVFATPAEAAAFLVDRPDTFFRASAPRAGVGLQPYRYGTLPAPISGKIDAARVTLWSAPPLGLSADELCQPYTVFILPSVTVTTGAPRYARFK